MHIRTINFHEDVDSSPIGRRQIVILTFCSLLMLFDGFDTQVISFIVPVLSQQWHLPKAAFGPIFSAVFLGLLIGNFGVPFLTQRIGTRKTTIIATEAFGLFTLLVAFASSVPRLIALRVLTGIGLGAATPCAVSLVSEFSPKRTRATFVMFIYIGYSLGFVLAGFCCNVLIPAFGWQGPLWLGSLCALVVMLLLISALSESPAYLALRQRHDELIFTARRLFPAIELPQGTVFTSQADKANDTNVRGLFSSHLWLGTFLLWAVFVINLAAFYFLQSWLPTVLTTLAFPPALVVWATALMIIGGMLAGFVVAPMMDRISPYRLLTAIYVLGGVSMYAFSMAISASNLILLTTIFCCGFCISGGQLCAVALGSLFYPAGLRAPGVAWAYGVGRLGAAGGTYLAGLMYANNWSAEAMFRVSAAPVVVAAASVAVMGFRYAPRVISVSAAPTDV